MRQFIRSHSTWTRNGWPAAAIAVLFTYSASKRGRRKAKRRTKRVICRYSRRFLRTSTRSGVSPRTTPLRRRQKLPFWPNRIWSRSSVLRARFTSSAITPKKVNSVKKLLSIISSKWKENYDKCFSSLIIIILSKTKLN